MTNVLAVQILCLFVYGMTRDASMFSIVAMFSLFYLLGILIEELRNLSLEITLKVPNVQEILEGPPKGP
jgi:hypothetical protein